MILHCSQPPKALVPVSNLSLHDGGRYELEVPYAGGLALTATATINADDAAVDARTGIRLQWAQVTLLQCCSCCF